MAGVFLQINGESASSQNPPQRTARKIKKMQEQQGSLEFLSSGSIMVLGLLVIAVTGCPVLVSMAPQRLSQTDRLARVTAFRIGLFSRCHAESTGVAEDATAGSPFNPRCPLGPVQRVWRRGMFLTVKMSPMNPRVVLK